MNILQNHNKHWSVHKQNKLFLIIIILSFRCLTEPKVYLDVAHVTLNFITYWENTKNQRSSPIVPGSGQHKLR